MILATEPKTDAYMRFQLLTVLRKIRDEGVIANNAGLCFNVSLATHRAGIKFSNFNTFYSICAQWPLKSGAVGFPVGGEKEFVQANIAKTLWDNPRRHELLHWMIMHLENLPNE